MRSRCHCPHRAPAAAFRARAGPAATPAPPARRVPSAHHGLGTDGRLASTDCEQASAVGPDGLPATSLALRSPRRSAVAPDGAPERLGWQRPSSRCPAYGHRPRRRLGDKRGTRFANLAAAPLLDRAARGPAPAPARRRRRRPRRDPRSLGPPPPPTTPTRARAIPRLWDWPVAGYGLSPPHLPDPRLRGLTPGRGLCPSQVRRGLCPSRAGRGLSPPLPGFGAGGRFSAPELASLTPGRGLCPPQARRGLCPLLAGRGLSPPLLGFGASLLQMSVASLLQMSVGLHVHVVSALTNFAPAHQPVGTASGVPGVPGVVESAQPPPPAAAARAPHGRCTHRGAAAVAACAPPLSHCAQALRNTLVRACAIWLHWCAHAMMVRFHRSQAKFHCSKQQRPPGTARRGAALHSPSPASPRDGERHSCCRLS